MMQISQEAAKKIIDLSAKEGKKFLRISVEGGGCAGFKYDLDLEDQVKETDKVIEQNGAAILVDSISYPYIENSVLDYKEDLSSAGFEIKNPNASSSCGCGNSFSI